MIEKREYPRIPMTGWVEIQEEGRSKTLYGYANNISTNGASSVVNDDKEGAFDGT